MKNRISPDNQKAKSLLEMSRITLERLEKTDMLEYASNSLVDYYDSIHKILEAICFIRGVKIGGDGAHKELIDYIFNENKLAESDRIFMQEMREFRNRISYEGFSIDRNYIERNKEKILRIIEVLSKLIE